MTLEGKDRWSARVKLVGAASHYDYVVWEEGSEGIGDHGEGARFFGLFGGPRGSTELTDIISVF